MSGDSFLRGGKMGFDQEMDFEQMEGFKLLNDQVDKILKELEVDTVDEALKIMEDRKKVRDKNGNMAR